MTGGVCSVDAIANICLSGYVHTATLICIYREKYAPNKIKVHNFKNVGQD